MAVFRHSSAFLTTASSALSQAPVPAALLHGALVCPCVYRKDPQRTPSAGGAQALCGPPQTEGQRPQLPVLEASVQLWS